MNSPLLEYRPELEFLPPRAVPASGDAAHGRSLALAAELLEVDSEDELADFLFRLIGQAATTTHAPLSASAAHALKWALVDGLRQAAHAALPLGHGALSVPIIDALGRSGDRTLKLHAARVFGLELEGLSPEDKEFELSQHFVHFADAAARAALDDAAWAVAGPSVQLHQRARQVAQTALVQAARRHAPGLLKRSVRAGGTWRRHGGRITVFDC